MRLKSRNEAAECLVVAGRKVQAVEFIEARLKVDRRCLGCMEFTRIFQVAQAFVRNSELISRYDRSSGCAARVSAIGRIGSGVI